MNLTMKLGVPAVVLGALVVVSGPAAAVQKGDWLIRAGATTVDPQASSDKVADTGSEVDISSDTQLGLTVGYMLSDHLGLELLAATPFKHTIEGKGGALDGVDVAEITQLPPTLSIQYHFMPQSNLKPYVGAGLTYFWVLDEDSKIGPKVSVDNSVGIGAQAGLDWSFNANWFVNADVRYINLSTKAEVEGVDKIDVDINPFVYTLAVGYKF